MRYTYLIFILLAASSLKSQSKESPIGSFEDFYKALDDPSINQQKAFIKKNEIKKCTILEWERSPKNDTLTLQDDYTLTYYNKFGQIDSILTFDYQSTTQYNYFNSNQQLEKSLYITRGLKYVGDTYQFRTDTTTQTYQFDGKLLMKEKLESTDPESDSIIIDYHWNNDTLEMISILTKSKNPAKSFIFKYDKGILLKRTTKSSGDPLANKSNEFIYENNKLMEITNTWMMATDSSIMDQFKFTTEAEKKHFTDITNTKYSYYDTGLIKSLQKVYGMWPGESFRVTTFTYFDNGLIKEKAISEDGKMEHAKIVFKYKYE